MKIKILTSLFVLSAMNTAFADDSISAETQAVENNSVVASQVNATESGWLVVHKTDETGKPGPVIGHSKVDAGQSSNAVVELEEQAEAGPLMFMLHVDKGEQDVYEFAGNNRADVPVMKDGKPVVTIFTVE